MDKIKIWWRTHRPTQRRLIQLYAALLYNANIKGFLEGTIYTGAVKNVCVPGFNCYSCPGAIGACPLGSLQNALASTGTRAPYYLLGALLLFGMTLGRVICGFLCPLGLIQELIHKLKTPKIKKSRYTRVLSYFKYVILLVFVILIPLFYAAQSYPVPAFCKYICPAGTFEGAIGLLSHPDNADLFSMLGILFTRKYVILIIVFVSCVFLYRAFCRFLCPLGAIYGLFSRVALMGVKVDMDKCTNCGLCVRKCEMDIRHVGDHECIQCGKCAGVCPTHAIAYRGARGKASRKKTAILWIAALLALAGALWYCNFYEPSKTGDPGAVTSTSAPVDDTPVGADVGMRCPDFSVPLYGKEGEAFRLTDARGKVTVINFWATWCTPCVNELPYFESIYAEYPEDVALVAIHSDLVTDDVDAYLAKQSYQMPFALDDSGVLAALGGSTMLPMTVVLDRNGVIVYNQIGSVTYELLQSLIKPLL